jgi:hypothetical protein
MPQKKPKIFIGSSVQGLNIARAVKANLEHDAYSYVWEHAFGLSKTSIDTLISKFQNCEYAVFVFGPDDKIEIKENKYSITRDNVIFEAGLFMGMRGRDKCFIITPRGVADYHILTDLYGFTTADYDVNFPDGDAMNALGTASEKIRSAIRVAGGLQIPVGVESEYSYIPDKDKNLHFPLKLKIHLTNITSGLIVIKDLEFNPNNELLMSTDIDEYISREISRPKIALSSVTELRLPQVVIEPTKKALVWIAFKEESNDALKRFVNGQRAGILKLTVIHVRGGLEEKLTLEV